MQNSPHRHDDRSVLCLLELLTQSSTDALAFALLFFDSYNNAGFELVQDVIENKKESSNARLSAIGELTELLVRKSDAEGNTILHHATAAHLMEPTHQQRTNERRLIWSAGRMYLEEDVDNHAKLGRDLTKVEIELFKARLAEFENASKERLKCFFRWIMSLSVDALSITNKEGLSPLDMLLWNGKTYEKDGLVDFVAMSPQWLRSRNKRTGLYPFQLAASSPNPDLSTIFELLRCAPEVSSFS
jgi:hypothetical protein